MGTIKLRLIVDMRRSGLDRHIVLNARIVVPRLRDVIKDLMSLQAQQIDEEDEGGLLSSTLWTRTRR